MVGIVWYLGALVGYECFGGSAFFGGGLGIDVYSITLAKGILL